MDERFRILGTLTMPPTQPKPSHVLLSAWFDGPELVEGVERYVANTAARELSVGLLERLEDAAMAWRKKLEKGK